MAADARRRSKGALVIGNGPEAALVASLLGASKLRPEQPTEVTSNVIWLDSTDQADLLESSYRPDRIIVEGPVSAAHRERLAVSLGHQPRLVTTASELESHFGRVSLGSSDGDPFPSASGPSDSLWRGLECAIAIIAIIPMVLLLAALTSGLKLCGVKRVFERRAYVGQAGRSVYLVVFSPQIVQSAGSWRTFIASSLERQGRRLHLIFGLGLVSVLRGAVSLVGPDLIPENEFRAMVQTLPGAQLRTTVRPGLVSLARVRLGQTRASYDRRRSLEYDLYYIKYRSLTMNLRIVMRAISIVGLDFVRTVARLSHTAFRLLLSGPMTWPTWTSSSAARLVAPTMPSGLDEVDDLSPTLVVGAGAAGAQLVRDLQANPALGLWPVALVDDDLSKLGTRIRGVPVLGSAESIQAIVERERIERVIVAIPSAGDLARQRLTGLAQQTGKPVLTMPSLHALIEGASSTDLTSVTPNDLLGRPVVDIAPARAKSFLGGKCVLVTGAAGSIGREVVIQALRGEPATIYGLDLNESDLYDLQQDLRRLHLPTEFIPIVGSVTDRGLVDRLLQRIRPHVVFHAAAYKHVPLMEDYPHEAVRTNIAGTWNVATASARFGAERFVLVSTDKAVRPSSVMGASKRLAELVVREISTTTNLSACAVRFGNVLGSRGSVIPLFERQIEAGGPVTITDRRMTRYFMTIPEAAGLIIEAGAFGDRGVVYMLDMDEPVKIVDVAERLIRLKGLRPGVDIAIEYSGLRPGEKLFEELSLDFEQARSTPHPKIRILDEGVSRQVSAQGILQHLLLRVDQGDANDIRAAILRKVQLADGIDLTLVSDQDDVGASISSRYTG